LESLNLVGRCTRGPLPPAVSVAIRAASTQLAAEFDLSLASVKRDDH
jgi:chaperone required for assembly of F1-ATPase